MAKADRTVPRWVAWAAGGALVVGAWFVALGTPSEDEIQGPMTVTAAVVATGAAIEIVALWVMTVVRLWKATLLSGSSQLIDEGGVQPRWAMLA